MATHADIEELLTRRGDTDFEVKAAQDRDGDGELSRSVWEPCSAMANTDGGLIPLGAKEDANGSVTLFGLRQPDKVRKACWDQINDRHGVSANVLQSHDSQVIERHGKHLLCVFVQGLVFLTVPHHGAGLWQRAELAMLDYAPHKRWRDKQGVSPLGNERAGTSLNSTLASPAPDCATG